MHRTTVPFAEIVEMSDIVGLVVQQFELVLKGWIEADRHRLGAEFDRQASEMGQALAVLMTAIDGEIAATDIWVASPAQIADRRDLLTARRNIESVSKSPRPGRRLLQACSRSIEPAARRLPTVAQIAGSRMSAPHPRGATRRWAHAKDMVETSMSVGLSLARPYKQS